MLDDEDKLSRKIATAKSKKTYLEHLKMEAANPEEQRICVICREIFEIGALTVCGHQYCKECGMSISTKLNYHFLPRDLGHFGSQGENIT